MIYFHSELKLFKTRSPCFKLYHNKSTEKQLQQPINEETMEIEKKK